MASTPAVGKETRVTLSFLDRLTDLDPDVAQEGPLSPSESLRQLKTAVCSDLAALLNTKRSENDPPKEFEEANKSLLAFGLPDFTSFSLASTSEQERLRRAIEQAIKGFEPRLARVSVSLQPREDLQPSIRYRVEALLRIEPVPEPITFDTVLHSDSRKIEVRGEAR